MLCDGAFKHKIIMLKLNENNGIFLNDQEYYDKGDLLNLYRLQKVLLDNENIVANLIECANMWQRYSNNLQASWLFFPENDDDILKQISSSNFFTSYEDYLQ